MKKEAFKLYDVVALMKSMPSFRLQKGQVGTIVEQYTEEDFEVEFAMPSGEAIAILTLKANDLMLLHYKPEMAK